MSTARVGTIYVLTAEPGTATYSLSEGYAQAFCSTEGEKPRSLPRLRLFESLLQI